MINKEQVILIVINISKFIHSKQNWNENFWNKLLVITNLQLNCTLIFLGYVVYFKGIHPIRKFWF